MSIISRWKAPTPDFFKKVIKISLTISAGAGAALMVEPIGSAMIKGFTFTLYPVVELICKNLVAAGIVAAAVSKFAKADTITEEVSIKKTTEVEEPDKVEKIPLDNFPDTSNVPTQPKKD